MPSLKEIRIDKGFTQSSIASALQISQQKYSKLEKNPNKISVSLALRIAELLKIKDMNIFLN